MSLNRVSYLESWGQTRPVSRQQQQQGQEDGDSDSVDGRNVDLPEGSISSSFQSTYTYRLNFNPYAGPGWTQPPDEVAPEDLVSGPETPTIKTQPKPLDESDRGRYDLQDASLKLPDEDYPLQTTGAFEVSSTRRICQVIIAVIYCFLAAGVVFGFAALKPVLIREGVYRNLCSRDELSKNRGVCYGQELRLNLMFTIAAVATNVCALPVGTILDKYGPRVCGIIGSICLTFGALLLSFAANLPFDAYIPGYLFLSLGGPFIFISSFQLSNTFPTRSGMILSMLTGAFDASSALFLIFRLTNERTNGSFTTHRFFMVYLIVPAFILAAQLLIMPATSYKTAGELVQQAEAYIADEANDRVDERISNRSEGERQRNDRRVHRQDVVSQIQDLLGDSSINDVPGLDEFSRTTLPPPDEAQDRIVGKTPPRNTTAGAVWGALHGRSALQQIATPWFVLIMLFTVLQMLRINYFVASIRAQYDYLLSPALSEQLNSVFDFLLPLGGLLSVPFIGTILDTLKTQHVLLILASTATVIGILGCIPHNLPAGYANIALFVIYRPFYYTAVSDYAAKVFGFQTFGKVYGLIICLAGLGNFLQAGLDALTFKLFARDPVPVNLVLTASTGVIGGALVAFVWWQAKRMDASRAQGIAGKGVVVDVDDGRTERTMVQSEQVSRTRSDAVDYAGVAARDWEREREREPLLRRGPQHLGAHGEASSYGISSGP
ncbi:putative MFS transporter Fmp42 [Aspergillus fischeri NRRL 181]|uniref:MFS amino acid transporter, putative n=1 Tax=Neosartorya fischeri (strain ATCC 1020 / DSM 3700 / CBS 544.65 / FGSC A1164 / JCM 1740 / NRRL 181 / WB 181) TaxID=331117 RepID=A1D945_NEOFI|nr:MFS amino acid transporter, putative [Aspergillus fischeri NRRL 181]EAW20906.1 MFS amino acid transporter, putative [Aspergillus fischeri NRRL 181]